MHLIENHVVYQRKVDCGDELTYNGNLLNQQCVPTISLGVDEASRKTIGEWRRIRGNECQIKQMEHQKTFTLLAYYRMKCYGLELIIELLNFENKDANNYFTYSQ
ncbi:hypothetical protein T10_12759 [Trichinella papuae]|uniref:Uncharacterized protein n=1 Tax=Trichinella papuae TaxID=268474 RepID=A0A0V1MF03_9BILA|nr:hypothetical protein T10_12759 [Trichinella papuae]